MATNLSAPKKGEAEFDDVVSDNAQYGRIQFWDLRYASEHEPFEWYYGYEYFRESIRDAIPVDSKVLIAGCGSSNLVGDMAEDGYKNLVANDISRVVVTQLKYRYKDIPEISYFQGTMCDTDLPTGSFGAVIDKALFDSLLCSGAASVAQYVNEVRFYLRVSDSEDIQVERLLDDTGVFIIISYGSPEQRLQYLEQYDIDEPFYTPWTIEVQALLKPKAFEEEQLDPNDPNSLYFVYICTKKKEMVIKRDIKLGRLNKKQLKALKPSRRKAPNLKHN